jgi:hypothetical protein
MASLPSLKASVRLVLTAPPFSSGSYFRARSALDATAELQSRHQPNG